MGLSWLVLEWIATGLCILANVLVDLKVTAGMWIWLVGTGLLLLIATRRRAKAQTVLFGVYSVCNVIGVFLWSAR
jgi:hypothetical protein